MSALRHIPLTGAYNFRDLGGYHTGNGAKTKWRRILRADSPHRLTMQDMEKLLDEGLTTVIDLRALNELKVAPNPFKIHPHIAYQNIALFDHLAPDNMRDAHATTTDDPLFDFYKATLATRQPAIGNVLTAIAQAPRGTVMFHCTAGKDRTGLISALLLGLAEVGAEDIISDYAQTKPLIVGLVAEFLELARKNGTDIEAYRPLLECKPETMRNVVRYFADQYNSVSDYLAQVGLAPDLQEDLKMRLLE